MEVVEARNVTEIEGALAQIKTSRPDAVLIASDILLLSKRKEIAEFMAVNRIPAIYPFREYAAVGGLFIYGANISTFYLDKLLKGEKVSNLPVQQATAFELIVNTKTASALGLTVPPNILLRADDVIE
jgi:putative ABC transport system substrate-binding protein